MNMLEIIFVWGPLIFAIGLLLLFVIWYFYIDKLMN